MLVMRLANRSDYRADSWGRHRGLSLAPGKVMKKPAEEPDSKGATERDMQRIETIKGSEVLGYQGEAREEHSGQNEPRDVPEPTGDLADNRNKDI
jgi:hypothetical protein